MTFPYCPIGKIALFNNFVSSSFGIKVDLSDARDSGYIDRQIATYDLPSEIVIVARALLTPSAAGFANRCGNLLRSAIDEVIDMPRSGRFSIEQLEKTEKTYIGTKVEILFRHEFDFPKGEKLDLLISGIEVDVKNTVKNNWTIPQEAVEEICILIKTDDQKSEFSVGLLSCSIENLNAGQNQDKKRTVSATGRERILWLTKNGTLPANFFLQMSEDDRSYILEAVGTERVGFGIAPRSVRRRIVSGTTLQRAATPLTVSKLCLLSRFIETQLHDSDCRLRQSQSVDLNLEIVKSTSTM